MENDVLIAGVTPGGLTNYRQIKILVCHILSSLNSPIAEEHIPEILQYEEIANYFEVSQAVDELCTSEIIKRDEKGYLIPTDAAKNVSDELAFTLPYAVKQKAIRAMSSLMQKIKISQETEVTIEKLDKGYRVRCVILDKDRPLMAIEVAVPDKDVAQTVKENFLAEPLMFYKENLAMLTDSYKV